MGKPGRPKASHTIATEKAKAIFAGVVNRNIKPISAMLLRKCLDGDVMATKELLDRGWGRPTQTTELTGKDGKDLFDVSDEVQEAARKILESQKQ